MRYILLLLPLGLFASDGNGYDIVERVVNFTIFFGVLYYLIGNVAKKANQDRIDSIANELDGVQNALKSSQSKKNASKEKVLKAKDDAKQILLTAQKEASLMVQKIDDTLKSDLQIMEKAHFERMEVATRKMEKEVIAEVLEELFSDDTLELNREQFVDVILKKVA